MTFYSKKHKKWIFSKPKTDKIRSEKFLEEKRAEIMTTGFTLFFDGACEPVNPGGTAAYGVLVKYNNKTIFTDHGIYEPDFPWLTSNNIAEYLGLLTGLHYLYNYGYHKEEIFCYGDSDLTVKQMNGQWRILKGMYVDFALEAKEMAKKFDKISFSWIPRELNTEADELSKFHLKQ